MTKRAAVELLNEREREQRDMDRHNESSSERLGPHAGADATGALPLSGSSFLAKRCAAIIAALAWMALIAQSLIGYERMHMAGYGWPDVLLRMSAYLTNLTVLITAVVFSAVATAAHSRATSWMRLPDVVTAVTIYIAFVGLGFNFLLRGLWTPRPLQHAVSETMHTLLPLLSVAYWCCFVPRFQITWQRCLVFLVYPIGYLIVTFWRGSVSEFYPYPFINVDTLGYSRVVRNTTLLLGGFFMLMSLFLIANHRRPHPRK